MGGNMDRNNHLEVYSRWLSEPSLDSGTKAELQKMKEDSSVLYDAFYRDLEFGTAGLRGMMGPGTNRMNLPVIRRVTQGVANYLKARHGTAAMAISYDSRQNSRLFAETAAATLAAGGVDVWIFNRIMPVPALSFVIRHLGCQMGIMITASHNAKEYNGYKVYGSDGAQILAHEADAILKEIEAVPYFDAANAISFEEALGRGCRFITDEVLGTYLDTVSDLSVGQSLSDLNLVYTPLNGAGLWPVTQVLARRGISSVHVVPEQEKPDGTFPTCPNPNPELPEVYDLATKLCDRVHGDLILATDPDSDRVGMAVADPQGSASQGDHMRGGYRVFTGNEMAVLLLDFLVARRKLPPSPFLVRTIVSTPIVDQIAKEINGEVKTTLIGFKYIGDLLRELEGQNQLDRFVFGFEEGNGFLEAPYVRDKDAVGTVLLLCEMAAFHKQNGLTLTQALADIYQRYGVYREKVISFVFEGASGVQTMKSIMERFRDHQREAFAGQDPIRIVDYLEGRAHLLGSGGTSRKSCDMSVGSKPTNLPKENIMEFAYPNQTSFVVRPSGTEPKLKIYVFARGAQASETEARLSALETAIREFIEGGK